MFKIIELWLWKHNLHLLSFQGYRYFPIAGGKGGGRAKAEGGISQAGAGITQASQVTGQEAEAEARAFEQGKILDAIMRYYMGLGGAPTGYLSPTEQYLKTGGELGQGLYDSALAGVKDPYAAYESQLQPSLELTQDYINRQAQRRGLIRSGIPIEQMGRAGAELAIQEARDRMAFREQELGRGAGMYDVIQSRVAENLSNLANLYGAERGWGQQARGRQSQGAQAAAQYYSYPFQARLGDEYGRRAALYALPGQTLGAAGQIGMGLALASSKRYKKNIKLWKKLLNYFLN